MVDAYLEGNFMSQRAHESGPCGRSCGIYHMLCLLSRHGAFGESCLNDATSFTNSHMSNRALSMNSLSSTSQFSRIPRQRRASGNRRHRIVGVNWSRRPFYEAETDSRRTTRGQGSKYSGFLTKEKVPRPKWPVLPSAGPIGVSDRSPQSQDDQSRVVQKAANVGAFEPENTGISKTCQNISHMAAAPWPYFLDKG
jgi:hypothetical protein